MCHLHTRLYLPQFETEGVNVSSIKAKDGVAWLLDLAQDSTAAEVREQVCVDPEEEVEVDGSRGTCNLQIGWGGESCKRNEACVAFAAVGTAKRELAALR